MQAYRHPSLPGKVVIVAEGSPLMQRFLRCHPGTRDVEYDEERRWFVMTVDTYRLLKDTVPSTLDQMASPPPPTKRPRTVRTVSVQTDFPVTESRGAQTTVDEQAEDTENEKLPTICVAPSMDNPMAPPPPVAVDPSLAPPPGEEEQTFGLGPLPPPANEDRGLIDDDQFSLRSALFHLSRTKKGETSLGYSDLQDMCLLRLAVRDMLRARN